MREKEQQKRTSNDRHHVFVVSFFCFLLLVGFLELAGVVCIEYARCGVV